MEVDGREHGAVGHGAVKTSEPYAEEHQSPRVVAIVLFNCIRKPHNLLEALRALAQDEKEL